MANELAGPRQPSGVREVNTGTLLRLLRQRRRATRTELIRRSGLSKATVSVIVTALVGQGFVVASGKEQEGRGRSRTVLEFNPRARSVIGAQIGDEECAAVLTDLDGLAYERTKTRPAGTQPEGVVDAVDAAVTELAGYAASPILGVGATCSGTGRPT